MTQKKMIEIKLYLIQITLVWNQREKIPYFRVSSSVIKAVSIREKFKYPAGFYSNPAVS